MRWGRNSLLGKAALPFVCSKHLGSALPIKLRNTCLWGNLALLQSLQGNIYLRGSEKPRLDP
jgi:hypothetical protein